MLLRVMFETVLLFCKLNSTLVQLNISYASLLVNLFSISLSALAFQGYKRTNVLEETCMGPGISTGLLFPYF